MWADTAIASAVIVGAALAGFWAIHKIVGPFDEVPDLTADPYEAWTPLGTEADAEREHLEAVARAPRSWQEPAAKGLAPREPEQVSYAYCDPITGEEWPIR